LAVRRDSGLPSTITGVDAGLALAATGDDTGNLQQVAQGDVLAPQFEIDVFHCSFQ
jgi:hypothetical protein